MIASPEPETTPEEVEFERRGAARHHVIDGRAWLGWREGPAAVPAAVSAAASAAASAEVRRPRFGIEAARTRPRAAVGAIAAPMRAEARWRQESALVLDVSQTGTAILADALPEPWGRAWLKLDAREAQDWVEVRLIRVERSPNGLHLVRLAFVEPCPYAFFKAAVLKSVPL